MMARVTNNGTVSEAFALTNGVKQDCVLIPTLVSLMFSAMLTDAYSDEQPGIRIAYRTDGHLLNSRRMQASTRVSTGRVHDLLFADDCALNTVTEEDMQRSMDLFAAGCADFGLTINTAKTVVMHNPPPSAEYNALRSQCNNNPTTSTSATPTSDPMTTTNPTTDNKLIDAPQPTITDTIIHPPLTAPSTATNATSSTLTTSVATCDYLPPAISNTTANPSTNVGNSVVTFPHCDHTFTSHIGLTTDRRRHRGTTDMIFAALQLQENCQEMRTHPYTTFVDLTKTFDMVNLDVMGKFMHKFGCPERFTHMVRQLHDGMTAHVTENGTVSEVFAVTNRLTQDCVLAPTLFSLMSSVMLMDA
ncbi:unnamed protein product [Schistocephalus solidus]|uniref:Reverse transcriptase domain-containing protein n=1 Tax=Schistocephalus solidus TaxID=70667 RepID=A0A183SHJ6_SCHSO|nr:unnamed protein product [Schistocephalus solidus]